MLLVKCSLASWSRNCIHRLLCVELKPWRNILSDLHILSYYLFIIKPPLKPKNERERHVMLISVTTPCQNNELISWWKSRLITENRKSAAVVVAAALVDVVATAMSALFPVSGVTSSSGMSLGRRRWSWFSATALPRQSLTPYEYPSIEYQARCPWAIVASKPYNAAGSLSS